MKRHFGSLSFKARHFAARFFRGRGRVGAFYATEAGGPRYLVRQANAGGARYAAAERGRPEA